MIEEQLAKEEPVAAGGERRGSRGGSLPLEAVDAYPAGRQPLPATLVSELAKAIADPSTAPRARGR